jgi:hypothetical protein
MKTPRLLAFASLLCGLLSVAGGQTKPLFAWDFSQASEINGLIEAPESVAGNTTLFKEAASLITDPDMPSDKYVQLSGTQLEGAQSVRNIPPLDAVQIKVRFKPSNEGAPRQTLVSFNATYEVRYVPTRNNVEFIVFTSDKKFTILTAEANPEVWNAVVATYKDGRLTLAVGLSLKRGVLPEGSVIEPKPTLLRIGQMKEGTRPFSGALADVSLSSL